MLWNCKWLMIMVFMSLIFLGSSQPMSLIMVLLVVTLWYSLYMYMNLMTFWYSFILLLVIVSGVLVIFTYMASMIPNEKFEINWMVMWMMLVMVWFSECESWESDSSFYSLKLWDEMVMMMNLLMMVFLMVVMLMVVWISDWWSGSVRSYWGKIFGSMKLWDE